MIITASGRRVAAGVSAPLAAAMVAIAACGSRAARRTMCRPVRAPRSIRRACLTRIACTMVVALALALAAPAQAQTNLQLWGNVTLDWMKSSRLAYELDVEPKVLLAAPEGEPGWHNLDLTPSVEYAWKTWLDVIGETAVGYTKQTDDVNSWEVTPRAGARVHLFSRNLPTAIPGRPFQKEFPPRRRVVLRDLARVESRNLFYTGSGSGSSSTVRFRNRLELLVPLDRETLSADRVWYLLADWEWFIPLGEPDERFANKQRIRAGVGYRRSFAWRFELLYMWTRSRNTIEEGFTTNDHIIDVRIRRVF